MNIIDKFNQLSASGKLEDGKELLLREGYIEAINTEIQDAYLEFIPPTLELEKELATSLKQLFDKDISIRRKASVYINKQSRGNWTTKQRGWLRDPRTVGLLIEALKDEDEKVVINACIALGMISKRYDYNDLRIYNAIVKLFSHKSDEVKIKAAQSIPQFNFEEGWKKILKSLNYKPLKLARWTVGLAVAGYGSQMSSQMKSIFIEPLILAYEDEKSLDAKGVLIKGIGKIGSANVLDKLENLLQNESDINLKEYIILAINKIKQQSTKP